MIQDLIKQLQANVVNGLYQEVINFAATYIPKFLGAVVVFLFGVLIAVGIYKITIYLFKKFKIIDKIDKLTMISIYKDEKEKAGKTEFKKISDNIKIDVITAKSMSYYVVLLFFRLSIVIIGIKEVENFLNSLIQYLPSLFIGVAVGFFGIRFASFVYDMIYYPLDLSGQKNAEVIAMGGKIIILFFTLMVVLTQVGIASEITQIILIGFIAMLSLAGGLAFGLGGKELAKEILESFKNDEKK
ncbi:hypothetical protein BKN14_04480 [Candidatus Gracilibacteria bacterium HOT-871]|nr:hypothetical protein BKN14_04480 [Candidatus Gracilibacteria bacterium HOT-871]MBB1564513.1 hypothetical protein [Candidatus Gracilibacteria bacterium]MBF0913420.1 hypothetical protein [Candidatus Gracilibacteria bacterium]RKW22611.1 MAG: hypothetical protein D8B46_05115 [Candidatus Gracilibacteria bacterium]